MSQPGHCRHCRENCPGDRSDPGGEWHEDAAGHSAWQPRFCPKCDEKSRLVQWCYKRRNDSKDLAEICDSYYDDPVEFVDAGTYYKQAADFDYLGYLMANEEEPIHTDDEDEDEDA